MALVFLLILMASVPSMFVMYGSRFFSKHVLVTVYKDVSPCYIPGAWPCLILSLHAPCPMKRSAHGRARWKMQPLHVHKWRRWMECATCPKQIHLSFVLRNCALQFYHSACASRKGTQNSFNCAGSLIAPLMKNPK